MQKAVKHLGRTLGRSGVYVFFLPGVQRGCAISVSCLARREEGRLRELKEEEELGQRVWEGAGGGHAVGGGRKCVECVLVTLLCSWIRA
jgi:hypothetical protein